MRELKKERQSWLMVSTKLEEVAREQLKQSE
jgi:hypothetical protein